MAKRDIPSIVAARLFEYQPVRDKLDEQEQESLHGWVQELVRHEEMHLRHRWFATWAVGVWSGVLIGSASLAIAYYLSFWGVDIKEANLLAREANQIEERRAPSLERLLDTLEDFSATRP